MKRSFVRRIVLLVAATLLIVALLSCSQESSLVLCNVKLDVEEASRSFESVAFNTTLSSCTLYYSTSYKGTDSSYYGVVTDKVYDSKEGILLSQGLWEVICEWKDSNGDTVATGTTTPVWVNLNTDSFLVYLDAEGTGSAKLSYKVFKAVVNDVTNTVTDVEFELSLSQWDGEEFNEINGIETQKGSEGTEENCIKLYEQSFENLDSGKYILIIKTSDKSDSSLLYTDVIGFVVKPGHNTVINGSCEVINGTSGKNEYITWEDDPKTPEGNVSTAGNASSGSQIDLTSDETKIVDDTIYVIQEDKNTSGEGTGSMDLSTEGQKEEGPRIVTAESGISFGINMNGTNVILSTYDGSYDINNSENTTIVKLEEDTVMTLFNYVKDSASTTPNTWGAIEESSFRRRYHANTDIFGGTLNIVGPTGKEDSISNIPIIFQGPSCFDCNSYDSAAYNTYLKQGSINVNYPGANIVLDGDVTVQGHVGISSWESDTSVKSTISGETTTNIKLKNGAQIIAQGDVHYERPFLFQIDYSDTAYGIKLVGASDSSSSGSIDISSSGSIDISLDDGHITTFNNDKTDTNEAGIYIENFKGEINITIENGSSINTNGTAIKIVNCAGSTVNLIIESGCTVNSDIIIGSNTVQLSKDSNNRLTESINKTYSL